MKLNLSMKTIKSTVIFFFLFVCSCQLFAESKISVQGKASIEDGDFYYVIIMSSQDSTIISSDFFETINFELNVRPEKEYLLQISSPMLFETYTRLIEREENLQLIDVGLIKLAPKVNLLNEVVVTATPPKATFTDGKFVYHIQNNKEFKVLDSFSDILKRLPLVSVDNDKISVFGKKNTLVLINGIPPKNDNWEFILPEDIKAVEVITNPSAEYSAGGMAVINIITNKRRSEGFNGQVSSSISKGEFWRAANNVQLGYSTDKLNFYSTVSYNPYKRKFEDDYERYFSDGSKVYNEIEQDRTVRNNWNFVVGFDYNFNSKNTLGLQYQRINSGSSSKTDNINDIYTHSDLSRYEVFRDVNASLSKNIYDLSYSFLIDTIGKQINVNMGYVDYSSDENSSFTESSSFEKYKKSQSVADIKLYTANFDYVHKTTTNFTGKAGFYYSHNRNDSHYGLQNIENGSTVDDNNFSNVTQITENKLAAYVTGRKSWDKLYFSAGLRFEHVHYKNHSTENVQSQTYNDLFPSAELGYTFNEKLQANLSYSKKVYYPKFQDLNPSMVYVDTVTYYMGNTDLQPEYSDNIALNLAYNRYMTLSLGYSYIKDPLYMMVRRLEPNSIICIASTENLKSEKAWTVSLSSPYRYKIWTTQNTIGLNHNENRFESEDVLVKRKRAMFYAYSNHGLELPLGFNLSITYQYNSKGIEGVFYHGERHIVNCTMTKSLLDNNLNISFRVDDIFRQNKQDTRVDLNGMSFIYQAKYDASYLSLSVKYKFGSSTKKYKMKESNKENLNRL